MEFPVFNSKRLSDGQTYNLTDPAERYKYFHSRLGTKISDIKLFLDKNTFVGYLLAKKMAGKSTYAKMFEEILGSERFTHISVGDIVRAVHSSIGDSTYFEELLNYLKADYRGFLSIEESLEALKNRTNESVSIPTELILSLVKREVLKRGKRGIFIDGMPRNMDQISHSLYFRDLIGFRDDPDFFVIIDVPDALIDLRMKNRRVCPICHTSKNLLFNPSKFIDFDPIKGDFQLKCDNSLCSGYDNEKLILKEGDSKGIESIGDRIHADQELIEQSFKLKGIGKILIGSGIRANLAKEYLEDFEIQRSNMYSYVEGKVIVEKSPLVYKDNVGNDCCTMVAATYVVNMFTQLHSLLI